VYHLAGVVGVARVSDAPDRTLRVNLRAALNVADWCVRHPPEAFFFSSTSEVADGAVGSGLAGLPVGEDVPAVVPDLSSARASYAVSKAAGESLYLHGLAAATRVRIARYFNVYGPRMGYDHVIPGMIRRAHGGGVSFAVFGAEQTRAFCHVDDAIAATIALMALPEPRPLVVNVGNGTEEVSMLDLAIRILTLTGSNLVPEPRPAPPGSPARRVPDTGRLHELTGFRAGVSLDDGLRGTVEWYERDLLVERP
jgi:UDP-glucose 4-epimerase/UDP-glucuronate decarboxylase